MNTGRPKKQATVLRRTIRNPECRSRNRPRRGTRVVSFIFYQPFIPLESRDRSWLQTISDNGGSPLSKRTTPIIISVLRKSIPFADQSSSCGVIRPGANGKKTSFSSFISRDGRILNPFLPHHAAGERVTKAILDAVNSKLGFEGLMAGANANKEGQWNKPTHYERP